MLPALGRYQLYRGKLAGCFNGADVRNKPDTNVFCNVSVTYLA